MSSDGNADSAESARDFMKRIHSEKKEHFQEWVAPVQAGAQRITEGIKNVAQAAHIDSQVVQSIASDFQAAMDRVYAHLNSSAAWRAYSEREKILAMEAAEQYLLQPLANAKLIPGGLRSSEALQVDARLCKVLDALSKTLDVQHWKMEAYLKGAIQNGDEKFAAVCQAASNLGTLAAPFTGPRDILASYQRFQETIVALLASNGRRANSDEMIDVALHTLIQIQPSNLYINLQHVELFLWKHWASASTVQYVLMQTMSYIVALYTINTTHFDMEPDVFLACMVSQGFEDVREFQPRPSSLALPPPFGNGPPLGKHPQSASPPPTSEPRARAGAAEAKDKHLPDAEVSESLSKRDVEGAQEVVARNAPNVHGTERLPVRRIDELEKMGANAMMSQGHAQRLARKHPYLLHSAEDLFLKDVGELLAEYRKLVMQHEALRVGLQLCGFR